MTSGRRPLLPDLLAGPCHTPANLSVFRNITTANTPRAIEICRTCPAATHTACLDFAVYYVDEGVWGGMSKDGLRAERQNRGIRLQTLPEGEVAPRVKAARRTP